MNTPEPARRPLSPSLLARSRSGRSAAYEIKFLLDEPTRLAVARWAGAHLRADPYADPGLDGAYIITSLYLDTPEGDVYLRSPRYRRRKYRVRRYGQADWVHLERKTKAGDRVAKVRATIAATDLPRLALEPSTEPWEGAELHERISAKRLAPACVISYQHHAFFGESLDGPVRLTIDRGISGMAAGSWRVPTVDGGVPLLPGQAILELKFLDTMPGIFKRVMQEFRLTPGPVSKYRVCREACGLVPSALVPVAHAAQESPRA